MLHMQNEEDFPRFFSHYCLSSALSCCSAEAVTLNDCLQLSYLPSKRNHMLLLYPREILILDLELSQTVGVVAIERSGVPFIQVKALHTSTANFVLYNSLKP